MYEIPGDYLLTYDPGYTEEHSDSSDFEEPCIPIISKKRGNHSLLYEPNHKNRKKNPVYTPQNRYFDDYPVKLKINSSKEFWNTKNESVQVKTKTKKKKTEHKPMYSYMNSGDQPELVQSKLSLIRHKVIPCLSSMFRRSHTKHDSMSVINEHQVENARDNSCQHCGNCERRRVKKLYKSQNYAVQPVYAIEGNIHKAPAPLTPKMTEPLKNYRKKSRNQYSSCSITSSSESETQLSERIKQKSLKMRKRFKKEIIKEHWKYQQCQHFKNQQHQYPSKDHKSPYQVFTSPYQQSRTNVSPTESQFTSEMPASSSGFWEYLFDKINRKYQVQKVEMPKACQCSSSGEQLSCSPGNCENFERTSEPKSEPSGCKGRQQSFPGNSCSCAKPKPEPPMTGCCQKNDQFNSMPPLSPPMAKNSLSVKIKPTQEKKIQCKCHDKADKQSKPSAKFSNLPSQAPTSKPCQEGHDEITTALADKYNGEILCIHNPPCILINGCLNLPPPKDPQQQMNFWPVTESKKSAFTKKKYSKSSAKCEQSCQYHIPYVEVRQCQTPEYKVEKKIQSICHHDPPCEVVRGCFKPKYDPNLQNSCVHVPMCQKIPECIIGQRAEGRRSCEHRPRCPDIPLCSRNYTVLTARENFGTQVRPKPQMLCRHMPPCIVIPKCLGRAVCESYLPYDAIPDCTHQPRCEMIPACCRISAKEMVSVSSQYPNSCRIV